MPALTTELALDPAESPTHGADAHEHLTPADIPIEHAALEDAEAEPMSYKPPADMQYQDAQITQLDAIAVIRQRPSLFIGSTDEEGINHLVFELIDNAVDEHLAGFGEAVEVEMHDDGSVSVNDHGRGIPTGIHPTLGMPTIEVVFTKLHAGGKFGQGGYDCAGGLHGVGAKCVTAFASWCEVESRRDGEAHSIRFKDGAVDMVLHVTGPATDTGTKVRFLPDLHFFNPGVSINPEAISKRLKDLSFINPRLTLIFKQPAKNGEDQTQTFHSPEGISGYLTEHTAELDLLNPDFIVMKAKRERMFLEIQFAFHRDYGTLLTSFCNNIPTPEGGLHVVGLRTGLARAIQAVGVGMGLLGTGPGKGRITGDDVVEGLVGLLNLTIPDPQFATQTKSKLTGPAIDAEIAKIVGDKFAQYLSLHPKESKLIVRKCVAAMEAREKARKRKTALKKATSMVGGGSPPQLRNCPTRGMEGTELYIIAGMPCDQHLLSGRDSDFQAVLPISGRLTSPGKASLDQILENEEFGRIIGALGAGVGEPSENGEDEEGSFEFKKRRFERVVILTDVQPKARLQRAYLLQFFDRFMPSLISEGLITVIHPPLGFHGAEGDRTPIFKVEKEDDSIPNKVKTVASLTTQEIRTCLFDPATRSGFIVQHATKVTQTPESKGATEDEAE